MHPALAAISAAQAGAFTYRQALQHHTPSAIRWRVSRGEWTRLFHGVYAPTAMAGELRTRAAAALLLYGDRVCISHHTAAALHGFGVVRSEAIHVTAVAGDDIPGAKGVVIHTSVRPIEAVGREGVARVTPMARTVVDLVRLLGARLGLQITDTALRCGLSIDRLRDEVDLHARLRGVCGARVTARLADARAESPPESDLRYLIHEAGLPAPQLQVELEPFRFDFGWDEYELLAEYDGEEFHLHDSRTFQRDREKGNLAARRGWQLLRFTKKDLRHGGKPAIAEIRRALIAKGWRPA